MEERRKCTSIRQLELMIEFLEGHRDLALGRSKSKEARTVAARLWHDVADVLNAEGPARTGKEWAKVWNDHKCRVRAKLFSINSNHDGNSQVPTLTPLEERVAKILGRHIGPVPSVKQNQFVSKDGTEVVVELLQQNEEHEVLDTTSEIIINETLSPLILTVHEEPQPAPASPVPSLTGQAPSLQNSPRRTSERFRRLRGRRRLQNPRAPETSQSFLSAEDVNVIVVDWSAGGGTINYVAAVANTVTGGESVARFINWLNSATGASPGMYHIVGHSLGGHMAGIIGRNVEGNIAYITALDAAFPGWITNNDKFRADDGAYTEVIHTNAGLLGYIGDLGHVDFYPNGGINMPGCNSQECDHARSYYYLAESLTSGGFTGRRCASYITAMTANCFLWGNLRMGGLVPKTGSSGIFYLETNAAPPFSQG